MVVTPVIVKPSEEVVTHLTLEDLSQAPHLPVDILPIMLLLSQQHHILVQIPLRISYMLTPYLPIRPDVQPTILIWTYQESGLPISEQFITYLTVVK